MHKAAHVNIGRVQEHTAVSVPLGGGRRGGDGAMGWGVCVFPVDNMERGEERTTYETHTETQRLYTDAEVLIHNAHSSSACRASACRAAGSISSSRRGRK